MAFLNVDRYSIQPFTTKVDSVGFFSDLQFAMCCATYMGVPCPIFQHLEGHWFGHKSKVVQVDKYGANVLALCGMPQNAHFSVHQGVKKWFASFAKQAGLSWALEHTGMFDGFLPADIKEAYERDYVDNDAPIIPDVAIFKYPAKPKHPAHGMQISDGTALLEIKGRIRRKAGMVSSLGASNIKETAIPSVQLMVGVG